MTSHATADPSLHERRLYVTTKLAEILVDGLEQLERDVGGDPHLHGRVDDLVRLSCVLLDELDDLEKKAAL